jgi:hypothetical protein
VELPHLLELIMPVRQDFHFHVERERLVLVEPDVVAKSWIQSNFLGANNFLYRLLFV